MSLRNKVVAMIFAVFVISGAMNFAVHQFVIMRQFRDLEREAATKNMERVLEALNREFQVISTTASDWAYWDDLYRYVAGEDPDFLKANLKQDSMENVKVNLMNVYDTKGRLIWGYAMDLESKEALDFGDISAAALAPDHPLLNLPELISEVSGLVRTSPSPLMLVARRILTGDRQGPANGTFVLGRLLDEAAIGHIAGQVRLKLSISAISEEEPVTDWIRSDVRGIPHSAILLDDAPDVLVSSTVIPDIYGRPFLSVRVATPRAITARGRDAVLLALVSMIGAGLLVMGFLLFMLHRTILSPLARLTAHTVHLGEKDDLRARLALTRKDEVGVLAKAFDQMIDRLAEARNKLIDQSFRSGIAEMANGVLHNIGNAITPLGVQLLALDEELRAAPADEMKMAVSQLSDAATNGDRRVKLTHFVELAGSDMADTVGKAREQVSTITAQVHYVQQILADQERFSRAARVLEPLDLRDVVFKSVRALSPQMSATLALAVDPGLERVGPVLSSRAALQQVVSNLLVNAAESIEAGGMEEGQLLISAVREEVDGALMAHLCFEDNGTGIREEHLRHIFEQGFSTKGRGSGLGLHWSANTVTALKGLLYAESDGPSRGARFHLFLPLISEESGLVESLGSNDHG